MMGVLKWIVVVVEICRVLVTANVFVEDRRSADRDSVLDRIVKMPRKIRISEMLGSAVDAN